MKAVLYSKLMWGMLAGIALGFWIGWMNRASHDYLPDCARAGAIGGTVGLLAGIVLDYLYLNYEPTSPRRFRFGLRSLFVVVTVVCVSISVGGYHWRNNDWTAYLVRGGPKQIVEYPLALKVGECVLVGAMASGLALYILWAFGWFWSCFVRPSTHD